MTVVIQTPLVCTTSQLKDIVVSVFPVTKVMVKHVYPMTAEIQTFVMLTPGVSRTATGTTCASATLDTGVSFMFKLHGTLVLGDGFRSFLRNREL